MEFRFDLKQFIIYVLMTNLQPLCEP